MYHTYSTAYAGTVPRKAPIPAPNTSNMYLPPGTLRTIHTPPDASHAHTPVSSALYQCFMKRSPQQVEEILAWLHDSGVTTLEEFTEYYNPYTIGAWINPNTRRPLSQFTIEHLTNVYRHYELQFMQSYGVHFSPSTTPPVPVTPVRVYQPPTTRLPSPPIIASVQFGITLGESLPAGASGGSSTLPVACRAGPHGPAIILAEATPQMMGSFSLTL